MSELLIFPILAIAVYFVVRHLKNDVTGKSDSCCGCSSRSTCQKAPK